MSRPQTIEFDGRKVAWQCKQKIWKHFQKNTVPEKKKVIQINKQCLVRWHKLQEKIKNVLFLRVWDRGGKVDRKEGRKRLKKVKSVGLRIASYLTGTEKSAKRLSGNSGCIITRFYYWYFQQPILCKRVNLLSSNVTRIHAPATPFPTHQFFFSLSLSSSLSKSDISSEQRK